MDFPCLSSGRESAGGGLAAALFLLAREKGEPFCEETLTYVKNLKGVGVQASVDIYPRNTHAFDMLFPWLK